MKLTTVYELAEGEAEFIQVKSQKTGHIIWINPKEWRSDSESAMIWGQISPTDESGWFFSISDLEQII